MYKNRANNGRNNICGIKIAYYRKLMIPSVSQRQFAEILQVNGLDLDKNAIQRIEAGKRFITDVELKVIAKALQITYSELLDD